MAANTDKFKRLARRWTGQIGAGGVADAVVTTIPLTSDTDLPTDTAVVAVIDRVDANGTETATYEETVIGVVGTDNLISCVRGVEGTAQAHVAGAVVEILFTNKGWTDLIDGILVGHSQLGAHATDTIAEKTAGAGVTIDGLLAKDSTATFVDTAPNINVKARAYLTTTDQSINSASWTKITLNAESYDVGADFDSATNYRFTAPVSGYYLIAGAIQIDVGTDQKICGLAIYKNNAGILYNLVRTSGTAFHQALANDILYLAATDYLELWGYQDAGSAKNVNFGEGKTWLAVHLLSV